MALGQRPLALIIHGWDDDPSQGWLDWLAEELGAKGYNVATPHFLARPKPDLAAWQQQLLEYRPQLSVRSLIVAHSLGTWLAAHLLAELDSPIAATYLVAGFADVPDPRAAQFLGGSPDWRRVIAASQKRVCVYSDDDLVVTPDRTRRLAHLIQADLVCFPGYGHFLGSRGLETLPPLLDLIGAS